MRNRNEKGKQVRGNSNGQKIEKRGVETKKQPCFKNHGIYNANKVIKEPPISKTTQSDKIKQKKSTKRILTHEKYILWTQQEESSSNDKTLMILYENAFPFRQE